MDKKRIVIVTGTGGIFGTGHMQRMLSLAVRLNNEADYSASLFIKHNEHPFPVQFSNLLTNSIPPSTTLIIRDMRDSSADEILLLKQNAPVLAIDDSGAGRDYADYSLNLLPVPSAAQNKIKLQPSLFLYGYNFIDGILHLDQKYSFKKNIDVAVYAGYDPARELVSSIIKSVPLSASSVLLAGGRAQTLTGPVLPAEITYSEIISRSKIVITHFGLTMYEAHACGCSIAAINPTPYHSDLTGIVSSCFNIIYSSEYSLFSPADLNTALLKGLENMIDKNISAGDILKKINNGTDNFIKYLNKIISNQPPQSLMAQ